MKKLFAILLFCVSTYTVCAINARDVHFRSAGVDVDSQKFLLQWDFPNPALVDTVFVEMLIYAPQLTNLYTIDTLNNQSTQYLADSVGCCTPHAFALRLKGADSTIFITNLFRTMQLNQLVLDSCANSISMRWSPYQKLSKSSYQPISGFTDEIRYHIYGYAGSSTFNADSVVWLGTSEGDTSYVLDTVQVHKYYHLYVAAVYGSDTSYSNRQSIFTPLPARPQYINIDSVLVGRKSTLLRFHIDPNTEYDRFCVEKSDNAEGEFIPFKEFTDKQQTSVSCDTDGSSLVFYRVSAINSCSLPTVSSPVATSLIVKAQNDGTRNTISWNQVTYNDSAATYNVYRTAPSELATFVGNTSLTSIIDNLSALPDSSILSTFCYIVEALIEGENQQPISYVRSYNTCSTVTPQVYMPNALQLSSSATNPITRKSRNLFEPVSSYAFNYMLYIYARNGKQIYKGSEPWNGRENNIGDFVTEGSYVYFAKITFANGNSLEKNGNVTVVY